LAHRLADTAAAVSLSFFGADVRRWSKPDGSLATDADVAVEDALRSHLVLSGRATLCSAKSADRRGYTRGDGSLTASTALWTSQPARLTGEHLLPSRSTEKQSSVSAFSPRTIVDIGPPRAEAHSAQLEVRSIGSIVSSVRDLRNARSYLPPTRWLPDKRAHTIASVLAAATRLESHVDHPALQVAATGYELAVFLIAGPWDLAAPALIVEEAGGRFTDLDGLTTLNSGTAVVSNGLVHEDVLKLVL